MPPTHFPPHFSGNGVDSTCLFGRQTLIPGGTPMADETGQLVGDYEVLAKLGAGGMGRVYKVRNVISNRIEAMKILLPDFAADADLAARFMAEIRTLAGLEHPGIAQLRTAFQIQNQFEAGEGAYLGHET